MPEQNTVTAPPGGEDPSAAPTAGWVPAVGSGDNSAPPPTASAPPLSTPGPGQPGRATDSNTEHVRPEPIDPNQLPDVPGFRVEAVLGHGGMGVVYRAHDLELDRSVALKVIYPRGRDTLAVRGRFEREVQALAAIEHPNIVPVYHAGRWHGFPFFTMKLVPGGPLSRQVERFTADPAACARLMAKVARAVHTLHDKKVIHRDLKPLNILLGDGDEPLVADFGLAKWLDEDDSEFSGTGVPIGTRQYMAPEQTLGRRDAVTEAADIWALGITLYELLAGRRPFADGDTTELFAQIQTEEPEPLPASVPVGLAAVVARCLAKKPADRYPTAAAVADDLDRWLAGEPVLAPDAPPRRRWRPARRVAAVGVLALVVAVAAVSVPRSGGGADANAPVEPTPLPVNTTPWLWASRPGEVVDALSREPAVLRWPLEGLHNDRIYTRQASNLSATCNDLGLLALGRTDARRYEFSLRLEQLPWAGNVGVFFGYQDLQGDPEPGKRCHVLFLVHDQKHAEEGNFQMYWQAMTLRGAPGVEAPTLGALAVSPSFFLGPGGHRLRVRVGAGGLESVELDGERVLNLRAVDLKPPPDPGSYAGAFGVYLYGSHGMFWNATYTHHEDQ